VVDGNARLAIVRHQLGCATLLAQCRERWADAPAELRRETSACRASGSSRTHGRAGGVQNPV